ncbi:hypothetical protein POSPLADRAFT_1137230, partial [Postia placenta MAD-698-R-SB12]
SSALTYRPTAAPAPTLRATALSHPRASNKLWGNLPPLKHAAAVRGTPASESIGLELSRCRLRWSRSGHSGMRRSYWAFLSNWYRTIGELVGSRCCCLGAFVEPRPQPQTTHPTRTNMSDTVKCANVQANGGSCTYPACNCAEPPKSKSWITFEAFAFAIRFVDITSCMKKTLGRGGGPKSAGR